MAPDYFSHDSFQAISRGSAPVCVLCTSARVAAKTLIFPFSAKLLDILVTIFYEAPINPENAARYSIMHNVASSA